MLAARARRGYAVRVSTELTPEPTSVTPCVGPAVPYLDDPQAAPAPTEEASSFEWRSPRMMAFAAASVALVGVIVVDAVVIGRDLAARGGPPAPERKMAAAAMGSTDAPARFEGTTSAASEAEATAEDSEPDEEAPEPSEPPSPSPPRSTRKAAARAQTVEQAYSRGCSTGSIEALSRQIIAEAQCLDASAYARVPARKNLVTPGYVVLHLEAPARDQLLRVLDAHPERTMKINSALRTVAQQYMLDRWARTGRCGIKLAAHPGDSNHETGLALDVSEPDLWRAALEKEGFHWMGASDRVHFDYQGPGARRHAKLDVIAFQRLWNRNHPNDRIAENGAYDAATEARIRQAPAQGFPLGASCSQSGRVSSKTR